MASTTKKGTEMSKNAQGVRTIAKVASVLILVLGVIYAETMYLSAVQSHFPEGILKIFAMIGAVVGGLSVLLLLLGKSFWFTEGTQLIFAYAFTGVEVLLMIMNILVAFEVNSGGVKDSWLQMADHYVSPATPVIAICGWIVIWSLDASSKRRHAAANLEDEQAEAEHEYNRDVALAGINLRRKFLTVVTSNMEEELETDHVKRQAKLAASRMAAETLSEVVGMPVAPRLSAGADIPALPSGAVAAKVEEANEANTVDADPPKSKELVLAQTGEMTPAAAEPEPAAEERKVFTRQEVEERLREQDFPQEALDQLDGGRLLITARMFKVIPDDGAILTPEPEAEPQGYTAEQLVAVLSKIMPPAQLATLGMYPPQALLKLAKRNGLVPETAYYDDGKSRVEVSEVSAEAAPKKKGKKGARTASRGGSTTMKP